jgi:hypothetical protein
MTSSAEMISYAGMARTAGMAQCQVIPGWREMMASMLRVLVCLISSHADTQDLRGWFAMRAATPMWSWFALRAAMPTSGLVCQNGGNAE